MKFRFKEFRCVRGGQRDKIRIIRNSHCVNRNVVVPFLFRFAFRSIAQLQMTYTSESETHSQDNVDVERESGPGKWETWTTVMEGKRAVALVMVRMNGDR